MTKFLQYLRCLIVGHHYTGTGIQYGMKFDMVNRRMLESNRRVRVCLNCGHVKLEKI